MNLRGRKASLPSADHARPEYVSSDGLVVHHYNRDGRVKDYDFSRLPVAEPLQRSLATLFADRCVPHIWGVHTTSENNWMPLEQFAVFLSQQDHRHLRRLGLVPPFQPRPTGGSSAPRADHGGCRRLGGEHRFRCPI